MSRAGEDVAREVRDDAAVGDLEARAVVVERPRDRHGHAVLPREVHAERLAVALRLVVAGARPGARHVAAIRLRRRDLVRRGIAVDLAAREEEEPSRQDRRGEPASTARSSSDRSPIDVRVHRLDRMRAIVRRRGDSRGVHDVVEVAEVVGQRLPDVVLHELELVGAGEAREPVGDSARVAVQDGEPDARGGFRIPVPLDDALDEVVAQEAGATGHEERLAPHRSQLVARTIHDRSEVGPDDRLRRPGAAGRGRQTVSLPISGVASGAGVSRRHGGEPLSHSASSFCLSLIVSIGSQKPSYR